MTTMDVGGFQLAYNSSTQPHPVITFNGQTGVAENAYVKLEAEEGALEFNDTYSAPPASGGWSAFTVQTDTGSLASGRYYWLASFNYYDAETGTPISDEQDFFAFQDVIKRDSSEFGAGWQLTDLDYLVPDQSLSNEEYIGSEPLNGVSLITGNNHAVWFTEDADQVVEGYTTYTREDGNPYSFATLIRDDTEIFYTLTNPDGSRDYFDSDGHLTFRVDRLGNSQESYTYDGDLLTSITDVAGNVTHFSNDGTHITSITDFYENPACKLRHWTTTAVGD